MIVTGRLCVKTAGRDAGKKCVIIEVIDKNHVLIDGDVRRRKCNIAHLELLETVIEIKKGASHEDVAKEFEKIGLHVLSTKPKERVERPRKARKEKKAEEPKEKGKKAEKKTPAKEASKTSGLEASVEEGAKKKEAKR